MAGDERVCLFGGTFDPIHRAHLKIAYEAARLCRLTKVIFIPAGRPPHKEAETVTSFEDRFRMVEAACAGEPLFESSRLEQPPASSYTIDTAEKVKSTLSASSSLYFLIGSDAFNDIQTWRRWQALVNLVTFIVAARPGSTYNAPLGANVVRIESLDLTVSSSDIRRRLASGLQTPELPEPVCRYISERGLYKWTNNMAGPCQASSQPK